MIYDEKSNLEKLFLSNFGDVTAELNRRVFDDIPGEYSIRGNDIYIKILHYETKIRDFITESHRQYIDLQYVYCGAELIRTYDIESLNVIKKYDSINDCEFYSTSDSTRNAELILKPDKVALFFPNDAHETQISVNNIPSSLKKAVVKINAKFFTQS